MVRSENHIRLITVMLFLKLLFCLRPDAAAQQSGRVYEFLGLPATARITALGGYAFPVADPDLGMALTYPSLMTPEMSTHLSLNFADYFGDINYGTVAFARNFQKTGPLSFSVQYINYGLFQEADETGQLFGNFTAGEYSFMLGWGRRLNERFFLGSNLKSIHSYYHEYSSWGLAVDVSVSYLAPHQLFAASAVVRNIGLQLRRFRPGPAEALPFEIVVGASHKFANAPLRLVFVAHNLQRFDLTYPTIQPITVIQTQQREPSFGEQLSDLGDQLMRHAIFGLEFVPGQNFNFRVGYNYRRRQEMKVESKISTVGLSWGFGIRIARFHLNYGRSNYHLAGAPNHISISTSLTDLFYRPEQIPADQ